MNIAIIGAGVGGLCAAIALRQSGHEVTIYERTATKSNIGAGIVCWPNATFVLAQLGLLSEISLVSGRIRSMGRYSDSGEKLGTLDIELLDSQMGFPSFSILRRGLMDILTRNALRHGAKIYYGHEGTMKMTSSG